MKQVFSLKLEWDLDLSTIIEYNEAVNELIVSIESPSILLLDFIDVTYMNSTAIWYLADWYNILEEKESITAIIWANEIITDTLNLVWLSSRLSLYQNLDEFKAIYKSL